ncbi:hypothetical protein HALLA_03420 (plasmid) [Halostagnicola larsenii XH-48]|uniref:Uncharacterized protein n=1 Tax=Halostagnicola larsenii XH-48 TaxID=797299 RepID=W0JRW4_9EURY|nr:hypothetical protein HALLA_03420 [Halostagnicola larsenii XH-48]
MVSNLDGRTTNTIVKLRVTGDGAVQSNLLPLEDFDGL